MSAALAQAKRWADGASVPRRRKVAGVMSTEEEAARAQAMRWGGVENIEVDEIPQPRRADTRFASDTLQKKQNGELCDAWACVERALSLREDIAITELPSGVKWSYKELSMRCIKLGSFLIEEKFETAGVLCPNSAACILWHLACAWSKKLALNCNPRLSPDELGYVLAFAECQVLLADFSYAQLVAKTLVSGTPSGVRTVVWTGSKDYKADLSHTGVGAQLCLDAVLADTKTKKGQMKRPSTTTDSRGLEMYFTSGTTGRPKAVVLSERVVVLHALGCMVEHRLHKNDVWLHMAPMFHLVDAYAIFAITWVGGKHVTVSGFEAGSVLSAIQQMGITVTNAASTMITLLLASDPKRLEATDLSSLELLSCGGAPLSKETIKHASRVFGCEFFLSYGMTECCGKIAMSLVDPETRSRLGPGRTLELITTSGRAFELIELRVVSSSSSQVPENDHDAIDISTDDKAVGEVWIRGPTVFSGYHNNAKASAEAITKEGWFRTGDLATINSEGYLTITDRAKDMILVGSENVYCVEVERVLHDHPAVKHASVFGVPDEALGERVKAVVVLEKANSIQVTELRRHCSAHLADFKVPSSIELMEKLPMTGSGKVAKAQLKKRDRLLTQQKRDQRRVLLQDTFEIDWIPVKKSQNRGADSVETRVYIVIGNHNEALVTRLESTAAKVVSIAEASTINVVLEDFNHVAPKNITAVVLSPLDANVLLDDALTASHKIHAVLKTLLTIVQALPEAAGLLVATRGGMKLPHDTAKTNLVGGAVWGFCRSAATERSGGVKVVDLCPSSTPKYDASWICTELNNESSTTESAWRKGERFEPRLKLIEAPFPIADLEFATGRHLITGGTGGLGLELAERIAERGGKEATLILASRRAPSAEVSARLEAIRKKTKASIIVERGDVAMDAERLVQTARAHTGSADTSLSIWHLAGLVDDGAAKSLTWERFAQVLAPKIQGSLALANAAKDATRIVFFSSIYGLLGSRELTHYAAANAFQDGLATALRGAGTQAIAVSWGTWADAGMAHRFGAGFEAHVKSTGMRFVPLDGGFATLAALASTSFNSAHAAVLPADWSQYAKMRTQTKPHPLALALCPQTQEVASQPTKSASGNNVLAISLSIVSELIGSTEIDVDAPVSTIGVSSVHIVELVSRLAEELGTDISPTLVYECVSIRGLANRLEEENAPTTTAAAPQVQRRALTTPRLEQLAKLADDAVRTRALCAVVADHAASLLNTTSSSLDLDAPLVTLGLSSLHTVEVTNFLAEELDIEVSPTLIFEFVSIRGVCNHLVSTLALEGKVIQDPQVTLPLITSTDAPLRLRVTASACRLPGKANSSQELWSNLIEGVDAIMDQVPSDRPHNGRASGYLTGSVLSGFDRVAFGVSAAEAAHMDPQQRLFLECSAEVLERCGRRSVPAQPGARPTKANDVGVFAAIETSDYAFLHQKALDNGGTDADAYCGTGWHGCVGPNRVSYLFDLRGPSMALNTACSSSLTCVSVARHAIAANECGAALVGGANLQLQPHWSCAFTAAGMLSPTNRCRFGDDDADGYVRGEGIGVIAIERVDETNQDEEEMYAFIQAVGVGQDGRSNGLTAPNPGAQAAILNAAYGADDDLRKRVHYVEAHGTGTRLGDPIELSALSGAGLGAAENGKLRCASIKASIGHLEGCSGLAGLLKATICLEQATTQNRLPRSLHFNKPNSHVDWSKVAVVGSDNEPFFTDAKPKQAAVGISSFGFGGALGHVVLERRCLSAVKQQQALVKEPYFLPLSAHSAPALVETARRVAKVVEVEDTVALARLASARVEVSPRKVSSGVLVLPGETPKAVAQRLLNCGNDQPANKADALVFVFTGQGAAYPGMAKSLYEKVSVFKTAFDECADACATYLETGRKGLDELALSGNDTLSDSQELSQPALFCLQVALAKTMFMLTEKKPVAVAGHSLGEIAAMCIAGVLLVRDAAKLVCGRGAAMASLSSGLGAMAAVRADARKVTELIGKVEDVTIAADNSGLGCTLSGPIAAVDAALSQCDGLQSKKLDVVTGFHSKCVDPCIPTLRAAAQGVRAVKPNEIAVFSTLTGTRLEDAPNTEYWCSQARGAVRFAPAVRAMLDDLKQNVLAVEIGPSAHLVGHLRNIIEEHGCKSSACPTLKGPKKRDLEVNALSDTVAFIYGALGSAKCLEPTSSLRADRLPSTAMISSGPFWFKEEESNRRRKKRVSRDDTKIEVRHDCANCLSFAAKWQPLNDAMASTATRSHVLLLRDASPGAREMAAWLRRVPGASVTELPVAAATHTVVAQSWDAVVFAAGWWRSSDTSKTGSNESAADGSQKLGSERTPLLKQKQAQPELAEIRGAVARVEPSLAAATEAAAHLQSALAATLLSGTGRSPRQFIVATPALDEAGCPVAAGALVGLARSARREAELAASKTSIRVIEVAQGALARADATIIVCAAQNDDLRLGADGVLACRRIEAIAQEESSLSAEKAAERLVNDMVICITGGTGALGLLTAEYLIKRGARGIVLLTRSGKSRKSDAPLREKLDEAAKSAGATVEVIKLDVSDADAVTNFLMNRGASIDGVVHAAGIANDGSLSSRSPESLETALKPKAHGALRFAAALDAAHRAANKPRRTLEVYFSSVTALMGNAGQTDYGAANAALDALAQSRSRVKNRTVVSLQWGPWAGHGMAAHAKNKGSGTEQAPFLPLEPKDAFAQLDAALQRSGRGVDAVVSIVAYDWKALGQAATNSALIHRLVEPILPVLPPPPTKGGAKKKKKSSHRAKKSTATKVDPSAAVLKVFTSHMASADIALSAATPIISLGLDSLEIMAIVRDVNTATGAALSVVDILSAATIGDIISVCPSGEIEPDYEVEEIDSESDEESSDSELEEEEEEAIKEAVPKRPEEVMAVVSKHAAAECEVSMGTTLASLALDSLEIMAIVRDVNGAMGSELSVVDVLQASSMEELAALALASAAKLNKPKLTESGSVTVPGASRVTKTAASSKSSVPLSKAVKAVPTKSVAKSAPLAKTNKQHWAPARELCESGHDVEAGCKTLSTAKPLKEPSMAYRFYFTVLCHLVGTQILLWGFIPVSWAESLLPLRFKIMPKLEVIDSYNGYRVLEWLEILLPRFDGTYPGVPLGFLRPWERHGEHEGFQPTFGWSISFLAEFCFILIWYHFIFCLGCHVAMLITKWLVVGKQRPGVFPIWESSAGWRSALLVTAHAASFYQIWTGLDEFIPGRFISMYARLMGARVGERVSWSGGVPIPDYGGFDLLTIGNDVVFDAGSRVNPVMLTSTCVVTHGHVRIGNRARLGLVSEVRHGANLGDDSVVCAGAGAMGYVPQGGYALSANVVKRFSPNEQPPAGAVDTKIRVPGTGQHFVYEIMPLLSYLILFPACVFLSLLINVYVFWKLPPRLSAACVCVASGSMAPIFVAVLARVLRFICYGPNGARGLGAEVRLTPGFVLSYSLVATWTALADAFCSVFYLYSGGQLYVWRLLGMRVSTDGTILSEILSNHGLMDLVNIGSSTYLAARSAISVADVDARRCMVRLKPIRIGNSCFVGPLTVLMPGATIDDNAATGSCAVVGERTHCSAGRIAIGDGERTLTLAWKPKPMDAFKNYEKSWCIYSTALFYVMSLCIRFISIAPSWFLLLGGLRLARNAEWAPRITAQHATEVQHMLSPVLRVWVNVMDTVQWALFVLLLFCIALHIVIPFRASLHICMKHILLGKVKDDGAAYPLRGRVHQAWCAVMKLGRVPAMPKSVRFLFEFINTYLRCLGAHIGKGTRVYPEPEVSQAFPEADVISYGDNVAFSAHMYGHDFNMLHLKFKRTTAANGVKAYDAWQTQVLPGCHLPENTNFHNVGRSVVFSGLITEPDRTWTGNPVRLVNIDSAV